jgi:hypothetical protein
MLLIYCMSRNLELLLQTLFTYCKATCHGKTCCRQLATGMMHLLLLFLNLLLPLLVTLCTSRAAPPTGSFKDGSMLYTSLK